MNYSQTVTSLITEIAEDLDVFGKDRVKLFNYMLRFLRDLSAGVAPDIRFQFTDEIPDSKIISLPDDYGEYLMMGMIVNGVFQEMSRNKNILQGGAADLVATNVNQQFLVGGPYYTYQYGGNIGGDKRGLRPQAMYGTFDIDRKNGVIRIDPNKYVPNLYMLYKSTCTDVAENAFVHPYAQTAATLYTKFNYCRDRYNDGRENKYKGDLNKAMRQLPGLINPISLKDVVDSMDLIKGYQF
jgi:hypothetical protein